MKIYLTAIVKSKEDYRKEVETVLKNMVTETLKEEANELYTLHQSIEDKNHFIFYEIWKSKEGLEQHNQQSYIQKFVGLVNEKLQEKPQIYISQKI
jgi:quinol monooxygenase YgiN